MIFFFQFWQRRTLWFNNLLAKFLTKFAKKKCFSESLATAQFFGFSTFWQHRKLSCKPFFFCLKILSGANRIYGIFNCFCRVARMCENHKTTAKDAILSVISLIYVKFPLK